MRIEEKIALAAREASTDLFGYAPPAGHIQVQKTRKEFEGDFTLVAFPFVKAARRSPEQTARALGEALMERMEEIANFNVIKGFLNLSLHPGFWLEFLRQGDEGHGRCGASHIQDNAPENAPGQADGISQQATGTVVVEFSSPNTNKPLHLGHIRNNLLGFSVARLLQAVGHRVFKVNLVNDRGIHICKSMLAWMLHGEGATPGNTGKKGDKLVGDYYVLFERLLREQVQEIMEESGLDEEAARMQAPLMERARDLLRRWEARDAGVVSVWKMMNNWVYEGFDQTYERLGVSFDKIYYESDTYLLGKDMVLKGLKAGILYAKSDGSVWADLGEYNLDDKLLLRADGTSVYMTQDIGTARLRHDDFSAGQMIYVVGNEQNHHFDVLKKVLEKLGEPYAKGIHHLSYGMVELPHGRMKSREGTVVDADELMDDMFGTARRMTEELGKTQDFSDEEKHKLYHTIGMGALKYFILKVDPKKNMTFNPEESVDFNGHTGPFIQYTYARIRSVLRKAGEDQPETAFADMDAGRMNEKEKLLLKALYDYQVVLAESAADLNPAPLANYLYELARTFNQFYHEFSILHETDPVISTFRLALSAATDRTLHRGMGLLGIELPERM